MSKVIEKISEVGLKNTIVGTVKREYYKKLKKEYGFNSWHISPYELREYAQIVVKDVSDMSVSFDEGDCIIDVGCGLGEVIRNIRYPKECSKIGMDFSDEALEAARMLDKKHEVEYLHGSFDEIGSGKKIGCLITLAFMQGSTTDTWISPYRRVIKDNDVKNIVVDVLPENEKAKQHTVDFDEILVGYKVEKKVGPLLGGRYLLYYRKQ